MTTTQLFTKLNSLPDYLKNEVNDLSVSQLRGDVS